MDKKSIKEMYDVSDLNIEDLKNITKEDLYLLVVHQEKRISALESQLKPTSTLNPNMRTTSQGLNESSDSFVEIEEVKSSLGSISLTHKKLITENNILRKKLTAVESHARRSSDAINRLAQDNITLRNELVKQGTRLDNFEYNESINDKPFNRRGS